MNFYCGCFERSSLRRFGDPAKGTSVECFRVLFVARGTLHLLKEASLSFEKLLFEGRRAHAG
jgi:hypothetical protein